MGLLIPTRYQKRHDAEQEDQGLEPENLQRKFKKGGAATRVRHSSLLLGVLFCSQFLDNFARSVVVIVVVAVARRSWLAIALVLLSLNTQDAAVCHLL